MNKVHSRPRAFIALAHFPTMFNFRPSKQTLLCFSVSYISIATVITALRFYTYFYIARKKGGWILTWATVGWV